MRTPRWLAAALGVALLAGIMVAWTPRYWGICVAVASLSAIAVLWALVARDVALPRQTILVVPLATWGALQVATHQTLVPWPTLLASIAWIMGGVSFVLGSQILGGRRNRKTFLDLIMWASTALAAAATFQIYVTPGRLFGTIPVAGNVVGTFFYKNQFAAFMELAAPIALWKVFEGEVFPGGLCYAAMFAATLASGSRAGVLLVSMEFLAFLILMVSRRRMPAKSLAAIVAVVLLLMAGAAMVAGTEKIRSRFEERNPLALRKNLLEATLKMIPLHPLFGSGMGTWPLLFPRFATFDSNVYVNEAHNDWAQWTAEGGIPFTVLLAALVFLLARPAFRSLWGLGIIAVLGHSFFDYPLREPALMFLFFTLAGAITKTRESMPQIDPEIETRAKN
jgi:O-antigen ligase